jgi:murein L,D-transpeptidase YafK
MKNLFTTLIFLCPVFFGFAQPQQSKAGTSFSFINYQKSFPRPTEALQRKADTLQKQFEARNLTWPARYIYIRSFKYDSQLEVWVKNDVNEMFKLFKTYRVCALAGTLGPKRMEGDYQVPEGFYAINEFNPKSTYYLSLGINYPNVSDRILSDSARPGSAIYIHGSCVTVGCIPIRDDQIDELYILAAYAKDQGQDFIPVHIFPIRFDVERSVKYLENFIKEDEAKKKFANKMEDAFDYFDKYRQLPVVMIGEKGQYIINEVPPKRPKKGEPVVREKKAPNPHIVRNVTSLTESVHQWPQYPGGTEAYAKFLDKIGREMIPYLEKGIKKAYVQVEFIVDKDGSPCNFKILKSIRDGEYEFNDELITRMEKMEIWQPAILSDKPVAKKMVQTVTVIKPD